MLKIFEVRSSIDGDAHQPFRSQHHGPRAQTRFEFVVILADLRVPPKSIGHDSRQIHHPNFAVCLAAAQTTVSGPPHIRHHARLLLLVLCLMLV